MKPNRSSTPVTFNEAMNRASVEVIQLPQMSALRPRHPLRRPDWPTRPYSQSPSSRAAPGRSAWQVGRAPCPQTSRATRSIRASGILDNTTITVNAGSTAPGDHSQSDLRPPPSSSKIISPQLGTRHLNQPSVFNGYAVFAGNAIHEVWNISNPYAPTLRPP